MYLLKGWLKVKLFILPTEELYLRSILELILEIHNKCALGSWWIYQEAIVQSFC